MGWNTQVQVARTLIVGSGPLYMVTADVNFSVAPNALVSNLAGISNLTGVIAFVTSPTTAPASSSPMQGPVTIDYGGGDTAPGYLILSGIEGGSDGQFKLIAGGDNKALQNFGEIDGFYNNANPLVSDITLFLGQPPAAWLGADGLMGSITAPAPGDTSLIPAAAAWEPLAPATSWSQLAGGLPLSYKLLPTGRVAIRGDVTSPSGGFVSDETFSAALPAAYIPKYAINNGGIWFDTTSITVETGRRPVVQVGTDGILRIYFCSATIAQSFGFCFDYPLD